MNTFSLKQVFFLLVLVNDGPVCTIVTWYTIHIHRKLYRTFFRAQMAPVRFSFAL